MDISYSVRWALINRMITVGSLAAGLILVGMGFLAGFQGAITMLFSDPLNPGPAIEQANPSVTVLFFLAGLVVWQFGKTYALFVTLPRASGRAAARRFDANRVSSAVTADLDDRLAAMEADIAEIRRELESRERDDHAASYDEGDHVGPDNHGSGVAATDPDAGTSAVGTDDVDSSEQSNDRTVANAENVGQRGSTDPLAEDTSTTDHD